MSVEVVVFQGVKFRRYPESPRRDCRVYFTPGCGDKQEGVGRLHEEIWKHARGAIFLTKVKGRGGRSKPRFCSNSCKSASRRDSGIDNETRKCVQCGNLFEVNKYSKATRCSKSCSHRRIG